MEKRNLLKLKKILIGIKKEVIAQKQDNSLIYAEKLPDTIDQSVDDSEKLLNSKFITRKNLYLKKIDDALNKIENDTYGVCDNCGDEIDLQRLLARPTASLCIFCKQEQEREERIDQQKSGFLKSWEENE